MLKADVLDTYSYKRFNVVVLATHGPVPMKCNLEREDPLGLFRITGLEMISPMRHDAIGLTYEQTSGSVPLRKGDEVFILQSDIELIKVCCPEMERQLSSSVIQRGKKGEWEIVGDPVDVEISHCAWCGRQLLKLHS